jgi:prolyl 4-hydroxylase
MLQKGCSASECYNDPLVKRVINRISDISGVDCHLNCEFLQLLRYDVGQYYKLHNDYIPHERDLLGGVRILTFYIYLSDVEQGGETSFPRLNITVHPKRGRAILWPNVLDSSPNLRDVRTFHSALPVVSGIKYGVNTWIHQRDYQTPKRLGC